MKLKQLMVFLMFLSMSCKMTEKNIIGSYKSKESNFNAITLISDHTFLYVDFIKFLDHTDIDSCHFITRGNWRLAKNELILNSFENSFSDTDRVRKVLRTSINSKESNISFIDMNDDIIDFNRVDDEKGMFAEIVDQEYSDIDIKLAKHHTLTFHFLHYKSWIFITKDTVNAKYAITLSPYYKQGYFNNKKFTLNRNKIVDNKEVFKKFKSVKKIVSPYITTAHF